MKYQQVARITKYHPNLHDYVSLTTLQSQESFIYHIQYHEYVGGPYVDYDLGIYSDLTEASKQFIEHSKDRKCTLDNVVDVPLQSHNILMQSVGRALRTPVERISIQQKGSI